MSRQQLIEDAVDELDDVTNTSNRKLNKKAEKYFIAQAIDVFKAATITEEESKYVNDLNEIMKNYFGNDKIIPIIDSAYWLKQITAVGSKYSAKYASVINSLPAIEQDLKNKTNGTRSISVLMKQQKEKLLADILPAKETNETMKWKVELFNEYNKYAGGRNIVEEQRRKRQSRTEVAEEQDTPISINTIRKRSLSATSDSSPRINNNNNSNNSNNNNKSTSNKKNKNNRQADFEEGLKEKADELAKRTQEKDDTMKELVNVIKQAYQPTNNNNDVDAAIKAEQLRYWKLKTAKMERDLNINNNNSSLHNNV